VILGKVMILLIYHMLVVYCCPGTRNRPPTEREPAYNIDRGAPVVQAGADAVEGADQAPPVPPHNAEG